jgi:hypothetical protein
MLRPMIFLTFDTAIFHEITGALLEFNVINFRFAAGSAAAARYHRVGQL